MGGNACGASKGLESGFGGFSLAAASVGLCED